MALISELDHNNIPHHVAIIMDGNGRWAKQRGLERTEGHKKGVDSVRVIVEAASAIEVKCLTIYAFSTENWLRPAHEIDALMELMVFAIVQETPDLIKNGVRVQYIGDVARLPQKTKESLNQCVADTSNGQKLTLIIALSYSSRWEITEAVKDIVQAIKKGDIKEDDISETTVSHFLSTREYPDPDLLIRTGGDVRISNFLLWQCAYAELYFTETFWPEFNKEKFYDAILYYQKRERRFGKISEQL